MTKKKILISIGIIFGVIFLAVVAYGFYLYKSVSDTASEIHQPIDRTTERRENAVDIENQEPLSFLITGVDSRGETHSGRSDTIIVMTVNPNQQSIKMVSIPRDTRTEIIGRGTIEKINHAYAYGGVEMSMDTVENFLDIPVDHYVSINMEGFKGLVDAVGGVTVDNDFSFTQSGHTFNEGEIYLDGEQALAFSRMRYEDPRGDFGRNDRQRQIVEAMVQEAAHIGSITRVGEILNVVGGSVRTDLSLDEMWKIQSNYRDARHTVEQMQISGSGTTIDGIYYFEVPDEEVARVRDELREHLELG
ncbi:LCP family glycopolymer transferase [Alkalihalobacillus hemicellulosilyticus]|uniref:Polyisoprenyl-teichoic acid--peptidoglycan teichoic acid transferase TagU n=1 Tax=Halalkalibacter hemicellulosilyticusJCM 9152 TaxID=1236971 RepID=W4QGV5_9BACI|nr:LCP family protein [Halalkalibacter hemicellulosilyticus]GAE31340.1 cell envelope-associated transcriptional attenuator LytR-CpsA-Psr [Halalkalibacter hemicellulosilyticusJCM 9152]